jgi:hypothetical protein
MLTCRLCSLGSVEADVGLGMRPLRATQNTWSSNHHPIVVGIRCTGGIVKSMTCGGRESGGMGAEAGGGGGGEEGGSRGRGGESHWTTLP